MIDGMMVPIFLIMLFMCSVGPIIAYSIGVQHGKDETPKPGWNPLNMGRKEEYTAYVPGKDPEKIAEGEEELFQ